MKASLYTFPQHTHNTRLSAEINLWQGCAAIFSKIASAALFQLSVLKVKTDRFFETSGRSSLYARMERMQLDRFVECMTTETCLQSIAFLGRNLHGKEEIHPNF
jgi:hypothetical protein